MGVTDEIKARIDIVDFIGSYVQLKKAGRNYKALCPFHTEKTPSFVVFPERQQWRCFGACGEGGDIFSFVMKREGWDFPDALRFLADKAGVELRPPTPDMQEVQDLTERLFSVLDEAMLFYNRQLLTSPGAEYARQYVASRGLTAETIHNFGLGYSPNSWDATLNLLLERGFTRDDLVEAGLLITREDDRVYDRFRNRLMIPIQDIRGRVIGFGARALDKDAQPKYLNSPQSQIFDKGSALYGMAHARRSIRDTETAVIVEGYTDVLQAHQAGFTNVVAEMGTALTESQLRLLARYAKKLVLALDPDTAGQLATDRGREVIERVSKAAAEQVEEEGLWTFDSVEREYRAKLTTEFDARGMLRYESRLGFDIRVITLPPGQDPDDLIREQPDRWVHLVENALPVVEYVIQQRTAGQNLNNPKVKSEIAREIVPIVDDVADPVERSHYRQRLARLLKVSESALFAETSLRTGSSPPASASPPPRIQPTLSAQASLDSTSTLSREAFCLAALIHYPRMIYRINRALIEYLAPERLDSQEGFDPGVFGSEDALSTEIRPSDFAQHEHRMIFEAWTAALSQDDQDPAVYFRSHLDPVAREMVETWTTQPLYALLRGITPPERDYTEDRVFEETIYGLMLLREKRLDEHLQEITYLLQDAENGGNSLTVGEYWDTLVGLLDARQRLVRAIKRYGPGHGRLENFHSKRR